jgi:Zn-dependent protease
MERSAVHSRIVPLSTPILAGMLDLDPRELMLRIPVVLLALTVHEFCHAYFALKMGDPTAYRLGRCSLNPLRHLDPLGTICLMFAPIGWAKPVPINPLNFDNWRKGVLVSTAAGPLSNVAQALLFALLLRVCRYGLAWGLWLDTEGRLPIPRESLLNFVALAQEMFLMAVIINLGLAVFNCLPLFPLDGFHITAQLVKPESQERFVRMAPAGPFMIIGLVFINNYTDFKIINSLIDPPLDFILHYVGGMG